MESATLSSAAGPVRLDAALQAERGKSDEYVLDCRGSMTCIRRRFRGENVIIKAPYLFTGTIILQQHVDGGEGL